MKRTYLCAGATALLLLAGTAANAQKTEKDTVAIAVLPANAKVEVAASFPGGLDGWRSYLEKNLKYPKKAYKKDIQGLVRVQMIVDKEGNVTETKALNDPGGGLATEAERVIKEGPKWIPAEQNGKKVSYRFVQNITFQLQ